MTNRIDKRYARLAAKAKKERELLNTVQKRALLYGISADLMKLAEDCKMRGRSDSAKLLQKWSTKYAKKAAAR